MSHILKVIELGKGLKVTFANGRPSHYLMMHFEDDAIRHGEIERAWFYACQSLTKGMQERAATLPCREGRSSTLFPEGRTYEPHAGFFLWEFWWGADVSQWDVDALWGAINADGWFLKAHHEAMAQW